MFTSRVDADLIVNPTLIKQELQSIATDALGVDEMQVSRILQCKRLELKSIGAIKIFIIIIIINITDLF